MLVCWVLGHGHLLEGARGNNPCVESPLLIGALQVQLLLLLVAAFPNDELAAASVLLLLSSVEVVVVLRLLSLMRLQQNCFHQHQLAGTWRLLCWVVVELVGSLLLAEQYFQLFPTLLALA